MRVMTKTRVSELGVHENSSNNKSLNALNPRCEAVPKLREIHKKNINKQRNIGKNNPRHSSNYN